MAGIKVSVSLDKQTVTDRIKKSTSLGQELMAQQALKDSNIFAKHDSGEMIASSLKASKLDEGLLIWDTPYAKRQYYLKSAFKTKNQQATMMWAHEARAKYGKEWLQVLQNAVKKGV